MIQPLLFTAVFPVLVAGLVLLVPLVLSRWIGWKVKGAPFGALALALAYLVGHPGVRGQLIDALPPGDVTDWPWVLAPLAAGLGLIESRWGALVPLRWGLRCGMQGLGLWLVARPALENAEEPGGWLVLFAAGLLTMLYTAGLDGAARVDAEPPSLLALVVAISGSSGVVVLARTASVGQLCGVLAAALFSLMVMAWRHPALTPLRGAVPVLGVVHPLLIANAYYYAYLPGSSAALLALTPGAVWISRAGPLGRLAGWQSLGLALLLVGLLTAAAAGLTLSAAPAPYSPY